MARFSPLVLPSQLASLPQTYGQRLPLFDGSAGVTMQQHIDKMVDFIYLEEVDEDDAKMRLISRSFSRRRGKMVPWFGSRLY